VISVCLIVKDEEKWIAECVSHLKPLAEQIVVGDTGSTDRTIELAKHAGAEVFEMPWEDDFAKARNATIERAREPWIFSFDADERISAIDIPKFRKTIEDLNSQANFEAIRITRRDYTLNPQISGFVPCSGEYPEEKNNPGYYVEHMVRIFRNLPYIRWRYKVHELIDPSLKGQIFESNLMFHHYGYLPEEEKRRGKSRFYQEIGQRKLQDDPTNWKAHYDLGSEYLQCGKFPEAVSSLEKAATLRREPMVLSNFGYALMEMREFEKCEKILSDSLHLDPRHHDSLLNLAVSFMRQNRFQEAAEVGRRLVQFHPRSFLGFRNLGLCMIHIKNFEAALHSLTEAIKIYPQFLDAKLDLAAVHFIIGKRDLAAAQVQEVQRVDPGNERANEMMKQIGSI
jgi:tetratricopeptide (TPR) repeat protein